MEDLEKEWGRLIVRLEKQFDSEINLKGVLYLIGVQELNFGSYKFDRNEKLNVLHVAVCKILVPFGYYIFSGVDEDGWPHYKELRVLKNLSEERQEALIKQAIIKYLS